VSETEVIHKYHGLLPCDPYADLHRMPLEDGGLIRPDRVRFTLLMVMEIPEESLVWFRKQMMTPAQLRQQVAAREEELQRRIYTASKQLQSRGYEVDTRIRRGKRIGEEAVAEAEENHYDFVLIQRRKQKPWQRPLVGSVADYVARRVGRPLLILPPR
jgi:nucleotide-binding universal stress UspA family protein